jgi:hypothetical protein
VYPGPCAPGGPAEQRWSDWKPCMPSVLLFASGPAYVVAACGCTDNEEWSAEAPEEVVQRRLYLPLLGMLILAPLFKASPTAALMA